MKQKQRVTECKKNEVELIHRAIDVLINLESTSVFPAGLPQDIRKALSILRHEETTLNTWIQSVES